MQLQTVCSELDQAKLELKSSQKDLQSADKEIAVRNIYEQMGRKGGLCALQDVGWVSSAHKPCISQWLQLWTPCILLVRGQDKNLGL